VEVREAYVEPHLSLSGTLARVLAFPTIRAPRPVAHHLFHFFQRTWIIAFKKTTNSPENSFEDIACQLEFEIIKS
jgi:hypothetical protein